jgi:hypothetical protein
MTYRLSGRRKKATVRRRSGNDDHDHEDEDEYDRENDHE